MKDEKRNRVVKIRLSDTEWAILNDKKSRPELARWIRETVLAVEPTKPIRANSNFPPELARILAGMGNNLNQIAKQLNATAKLGILGDVEAVKAVAQLTALERSLNEIRVYLTQKRT